jgi:hypothetical protein
MLVKWEGCARNKQYNSNESAALTTGVASELGIYVSWGREAECICADEKSMPELLQKAKRRSRMHGNQPWYAPSREGADVARVIETIGD